MFQVYIRSTPQGKKRLHLSVFKLTTMVFSSVPSYFSLLVCLLACLTLNLSFVLFVHLFAVVTCCLSITILF